MPQVAANRLVEAVALTQTSEKSGRSLLLRHLGPRTLHTQADRRH